MRGGRSAAMLTRLNKLHPALKHAGYSATTLLPGEDPAAFEKLHRALIHEFAPVGTLEEEIVADMARLTWRKQNLATFRIAQLAQKRHHEINAEKVPTLDLFADDEDYLAARREGYRAAKEQAQQELGDTYELIDIGEPATIKGLMDELDIKERLDSLISKCLKQLLMVRGVKSLSAASSSVPTPQISGPRKAG
jgi:hypothetical protein